ncbi:MAG: hypothetical protein ACI89U_003264, partial [Gammaproteobacteria bacterium]
QSHNSGPFSGHQQKRIEQLEQELRTANKPKYKTLVSLILLMAAILLSNSDLQEKIGDIPTNSWLLGAFALLLWIKR